MGPEQKPDADEHECRLNTLAGVENCVLLWTGLERAGLVPRLPGCDWRKVCLLQRHFPGMERTRALSSGHR